MTFLLGFRNLFRNPRRSMTVILTISFGICALFLFHGFNEGTVNQYREDMIHSRYGHGQIFTKGYREKIHEKPWKQWIEKPDDVMASLKDLPYLKKLFPRVEFFAMLSNGNTTVSARGQAVNGADEASFFTTLNIEEGVTLSDQSDGILVGRGIANTLGVKVGDTLSLLTNTIHGSINGLEFNVVGIFHTGIKEFDDSYFRIPLDKGFQLLDTQSVENISVGLRSYEDWPAFEAHVSKELPGLEAISFAVLDKTYYQHTVDWLEAQFQFIQAIIFFIVFLGILNTVSSTIFERKQEIGNLRANGESSFDVMKLLAVEGSILGMIGALSGIILAYLLCATLLKNGVPMPPAPGQTRAFATFIELQGDMALQSFILGTCAAVAGTIAAAYKVLRLSIGEALRAA